MIFEITDLDPKCLDRFGLKMQCAWFLWNLALENKSSVLIMNMSFGIGDLDPCFDYGTWSWWYWLKITNLGKFVPSTEISSDFYEIWHSQQIVHVYYEYNTRQCLEPSHDYRLRLVIGTEHSKELL